MRALKPGEALVQAITDESTKRRLKALAAVRGNDMGTELTEALNAHLARFAVPDLGDKADAIARFTDRMLDA